MLQPALSKTQKTRKPRVPVAGQLADEQKAISAPTAVATPAPSPPRAPPPPQPPAATQAPVAAGVLTPEGMQEAPSQAAPPVGPSPTAPVLPPGGLGAGALPPGGVGASPAPTADEDRSFVDVSPQAPPAEFNDTAQQLLLQQLQQALAGPDLTAQNDLIMQQMEDAIGQQLVDQRASMGRAGFGGGTLAALEGDIQREARQGALQTRFDLERSEKQRAIENALSAIGSDIDLRKQAEDEFFTSSYLDALRSYLGMDPVGNVGGADLGANFGEAAFGEGSPFARVRDVVTGQQEQQQLPSSGDGEPGMSSRNPIAVAEPPAGARQVNGSLYLGSDGLYYRVGE